MLKEDITYKDFDENEVTETLHFNISKTELADNLHLRGRLEDVQKIFSGEPRALTQTEVELVLDLVKTFMKLSYGERSVDGRRFAKSDQIWEEFTQTAAYDAFLMSLFENPEKAVNFMVNVFPKDLREQAEAEVAAKGTQSVETAPPVSAPPAPASASVGEEPLKKWSEYTTNELLALSDEKFEKLVGTDPQRMTKPQLTIAMQRMSRR